MVAGHYSSSKTCSKISDIAVASRAEVRLERWYPSRKTEYDQSTIESISFTNVSFQYEGKTIFSDFTTDLNLSKTILIKGANGSGKSTLLRLMMGLTNGYQGSIHIGEYEPDNLPTDIFPKSLFCLLQEEPPFDLTPTELYNLQKMSKEDMAVYLKTMQENISATYEQNLRKIGAVELDDPDYISIYPKDFDSKEKIVKIIDDYNKGKNEDAKIKYTDIVGVMMSSITTIVNVISAVLIAFVAISLVVSSIMIAIITYISVIERTKEIGILRAMGASKKDISRVFNAETLIEGFGAGLFGIIITILLNIPINIIVKKILNISNITSLPLMAGIVLIIISMLLTVIAGFIPAKIASKKDPVIALRTE